MNQKSDNLKELVIQLHDIARAVQQEMGLNTLILDIRQCADRLNDLLKAKE